MHSSGGSISRCADMFVEDPSPRSPLLVISERLRWNTSDYGGIPILFPAPKLIWRPRVVIMNTLDERDMFGDDACPTSVISDGSTRWQPGSLFSISCRLSYQKYPFEKQKCVMVMFPMGFREDQLLFTKGVASLDSYSINAEWNLIDMSIDNTSSFSGNNSQLSALTISFILKRRPFQYVINTILPVVLLSLLNMFVFSIPVESGERLSFGITVVLSISVFLSQIGENLPKSSEDVPYVTIYLFALYVISVVIMLDSILIVFLHNVEEKADVRNRLAVRFAESLLKISKWKQSVAPSKKGNEDTLPHAEHDHGAFSFYELKMRSNPGQSSVTGQSLLDGGKPGTDGKDGIVTRTTDGEPREIVSTKNEDGVEKAENNANGAEYFKKIANHIDSISSFFFIVTWFVVTLWYFIAANS